jgi:hypothetical protein
MPVMRASSGVVGDIRIDRVSGYTALDENARTSNIVVSLIE